MDKSTEIQSGAYENAYAIIRNIPNEYHARHLRYFFADFVENEEAFQCFHYRHRPEIHIRGETNKATTSNEYNRFCCVVLMKNAEQRSAFIRRYHRQFWTNNNGNEIPLKCFIFPLKINARSEGATAIPANLDFRSLFELKPPSLMPHGNVGTPSRYFLEQIRLCKLPPSILSKLGIKAKRRIGKYGAVYFGYGGNQNLASVEGHPTDAACYSFGRTLEEENLQAVPGSDSYPLEEFPADEREPGNDNGVNNNDDDDDGDDDDDNSCEEWDRHEALHDDVTEQERTKPRKYEEEHEVTWEKGGPGLVWYTDTFFWKSLEEGTDSDWKWSDDWDVDYSIYYDRKDGDLDAKQTVEVLEDQKLRSGEINQSVFKKKERMKRYQEPTDRPSSAIGFGQFEAHTKGIGSKIMKRYGWSPGTGLGAHNAGRSEAVSVELEEVAVLQTGNERKGLGYRGEKLQRTGFSKRSSHTIATNYDEQNAVDEEKCMRKVLRREEPTFMKYR